MLGVNYEKDIMNWPGSAGLVDLLISLISLYDVSYFKMVHSA